MLKRKAKIPLRTDFPHGTCLKAGGKYYFVNGGTIKPILNKRIFDSWSFPLVVDCHESVLTHFVRAAPLGFRDGTLVRDISDGKMYLVSRRFRRLIVSPDALLMIGKKSSDAVWAAHDEVLLHKKGDDL